MNMYPGIPVELMQTAVQLVICFVSAAGAFLGLLLCGRA
jgi:hypothetical protein